MNGIWVPTSLFCCVSVLLIFLIVPDLRIETFKDFVAELGLVLVFCMMAILYSQKIEQVDENRNKKTINN